VHLKKISDLMQQHHYLQFDNEINKLNMILDNT